MANLSPTSDLVREFVIAAHGNLPRVQEMLAKQPELLNVTYAWKDDDLESGIQAAAHAGNAPIAEFLLGKGASLAICTAAMLGRVEAVKALINQDKNRVNERGAHGIPLLPHAAISGNVKLLELLTQHGVKDGASFALGNAVTHRRPEAVKCLLDHASPDLAWTDFQGRTPLQIAEAGGFDELVKLLRDHTPGVYF
jgi:ankyrin repeat protein